MRSKPDFDEIKRKKAAVKKILQGIVQTCQTPTCKVQSSQAVLSNGYCKSCIEKQNRLHDEEKAAAEFYASYSTPDFS